MRTIYLLALSLVGCAAARAQDYRTPPAGGAPIKVEPVDVKQYMRQATVKENAAPTSSNRSLISSSSYLFPQWTMGVMQPYSGVPQRNWLRYNAVDEQLLARVVINNIESTRVVDTGLLREFTIGDSVLGQRLTFRRYLDVRVARPSWRTAFFEVHYDAGRTALLCRRTRTPQTGTAARDVLTYFLKTPDRQLIRIALRAPAVLAALGPAHATALKAYVDTQQLDLGRERDVVRLLAYVDGL